MADNEIHEQLADLVEAIAVAWLHYIGYDDEKIAAASAQTCRAAGCEPYDAGIFGEEFAGQTTYDCTNEDGESPHPERDEVVAAGDMANFVVEEVARRGWRPPARVIETVEELEDLPIGAVVQELSSGWESDPNPTMWLRAQAWIDTLGWREFGGYEDCMSKDIGLPVRVVWQPEVSGR